MQLQISNNFSFTQKYTWTSDYDHLFLATGFPKYHKFPSQIAIF